MNGNLRATLAHGMFPWLLLVPGMVVGQTPEATKEPAKQPPSAAIKIEDSPRAVDPATLLPPRLSKSATVDFPDAALSDVVKWLQTEQKLGVILEQPDLAGDVVNDRLLDEPLYLLLDRLSTIGVGWYYEGEIVYLTSLEVEERRLTNVSYNIGDLLDAKHGVDELVQTITGTIQPDSWMENGGKAGVEILGDVLFVNQSQKLHRQIAGLLSALRKHGRRTYIADSPAHEPLRKALAGVMSVDFRETPLATAIDRLAKQAKVDIRLNLRSLQSASVRDRRPVSLTMSDQKLSVILHALLHQLELTWVIRDGVVWIESHDVAASRLTTAVYDVRDLCRDENESYALQDTITSQLEADEWLENGGSGNLDFPLPGVMVVSQTEVIHDRLLELLENYRAALRVSKPRPRAGDDPQEVITRYYRLPKAIADDLVTALPQLVEPDSWKSDAKPAAIGTILKLASKSEWVSSGATKSGEEDSGARVLVPYAVLIIKQTRAVHDLIPAVLQKIESGDAGPAFLGGGGMGGGMGGGGFGGGFF